MRKFTDAEKRQLQDKIKDERERQSQAVRKIVRKNTNAERNWILSLLFFWEFSGFWSD